MRIDYDDIQLGREADINQSELWLMEAIKDAVDDGRLSHFTFNMVWVICDYCAGNGSHSRRFGAMSSEDFAEWDSDSRESYLAGEYDAACDRCQGSGKIHQFDEDSLPAEVVKFIANYRENAWESADVSAQERRIGA